MPLVLLVGSVQGLLLLSAVPVPLVSVLFCYLQENSRQYIRLLRSVFWILQAAFSLLPCQIRFPVLYNSALLVIPPVSCPAPLLRLCRRSIVILYCCGFGRSCGVLGAVLRCFSFIGILRKIPFFISVHYSECIIFRGDLCMIFFFMGWKVFILYNSDCL